MKNHILWPVSELVELQPKPIYARTLVREMLLYGVFLIFVTAVAVTAIDSVTYHQYRLFEQLFVETTVSSVIPHTKISLKDVYSIGDVWKYLSYILYDGFHWKYYYNEIFQVYKISETSEYRNIANDNKLLGVPRLRQLRVRQDSCRINPAFAFKIKKCYDYYSLESEDRAPIGKNNEYSHIDSLDSLVYPGKLAYYPGTRGYVVNLAIQNISDNTSNSISVLKENLFLSRGTRVLFLEFTTYNPNTNLFCVVKIVFEFPPTGGVLTSYIFRVVRLIRYVTTSDYALLACEVVVLAFILVYTILFMVEIRYLSGVAFYRFWSYVNFFILLTGYVTFGLNILRSSKFKEAQSTLLSKDTYVNLEQPAILQMTQDDATAIFVFLVYIKAFKFLTINKTVGQIHTTIRKCLSDIVTFLVLLLIVFNVFALFGYIMFHSQVAELSSYGVAMFTLFRAILGDFNYEAIESANTYVAPIYFILFMFVVFFIMLNMFLAIINDAYYNVKLHIAAGHKHKNMSYFVKQAFYEFYSLSDTASQDDVDETPNQVAISEIRDTLNRLGFDVVEIELFFSRYNIDPSCDSHKLLKDFETKPADVKSDVKAPEVITIDDVISQQEKMVDLERAISFLTTKVDFLLKKSKMFIKEKSDLITCEK